ncbi:magnesium and cobalt transport protein CorA [Geminocystis sp. NIES-3708]|uniref:magnesium/cobalt transporter CorA n=1 Tax=Geminocystis sp. NIES-3708 TaxID=1615909 RepID=UPI0005FC58FB|nr:magnesium/cobalt transporter CorA [Geminocystis sp. NIES-3708]BAQ60005.1 magnesium and cobalt transport protein CorA [Geminocystis sp. NIES-3708]
MSHFRPSNLASNFNYFNNSINNIPGTLQFNSNAIAPKITLIDYNENQAIRRELKNPLDCWAYLDTESVSWINLDGLGDEITWKHLSQVFNLHPIALEDIVNVPQRPKVVEYKEHLVLISRMVTLDQRSNFFVSEQISFVLGKHYVLTIQEEPKYDCLGGVRERIRNNKGIIRQKGVDYLFYTLIDAVIDGFFPVMEVYGEFVQSLQNEVVTYPSHQSLTKIHQLQQDLLLVRRAVWPLRDALNSLLRDGNELISEEVQVFLRDCYDHIIQILDMVETYRDLASNLTDIYLSSVSNRMNEIMKTLTVISSVFIPLTFIAGIYGMNFNPDKSPFNMPELNWYWGYVFTWAVMLVVGGAMIFFFWRKGWFSNLNVPQKSKK